MASLDVVRRRMMAHWNGICSAVIIKLVRRSGSAPLARKGGKRDFRGEDIVAFELKTVIASKTGDFQADD